MGASARLLRENGLSIAFFLLFLGSLVGQSFSGLAAYNDRQSANGLSTSSYWEYLGSGNFLDGVFVNWQAAVLQLGCLIVFSEFLLQRGASHSRKPPEEKRKRPRDEHEDGRRRHAQARPSWLYRNSLALAFLAAFLLSAAAHLVSGTFELNHRRSLRREAPVTIGAYLLSSEFWFKTLQTWQAEFFGIWLFIVLSIFLRQQGSAESKRVEASNWETGETNE